ncbi:MAG: type II secretion system protein GspC [Woeseiaceae bacterium]
MNKIQIINSWQALPWSEFKALGNKHLPKVVLVLFIILLTQTLAELTWALFTPDNKQMTRHINFKSNNNNLPISESSLKEVSGYHLFGNAAQAPVIPTKVIDAPETRLRLTLKGIFASTNALEALAIISSNKRVEKTFHIGDKVSGGAVLHAVYNDRVILKRNGQLETLRLPKSKVDSQAFYQESTSKYSATKNEPVFTSTTSSQTQRLRQMRKTLLKDPSKIWQQVRINPVMRDGKIKGYTLTHNDKSLMKALNIKQTDIITSINGQSLSDPSTLYGLMNSLSSQDTLELTIERKGQQQTIQLNL